MKFKVVLPVGETEKTLFVNDSTIKITKGQIVENDFLQKHYPQFFESVEEGIVTEEVPVVEEPQEELLIEQPERAVEVEIVAEEPEEEVAEVDYESLTVRELKALASEMGVELTSNKKKDIIAQLKG